MRIAIIGAGPVGSTLGARWAALGHAVTYGVRDPADARHGALTSGGNARLATPADAAAGAEVVVLTVPWPPAADVVRGLGDLGTRVVLDCTNPVSVTRAGVSPVDTGGRSGAEILAAAARGGRFVKTLNQVGVNVMADTSRSPTPPLQFVAGDDAAAKDVARELVAQLGFDVRDAGPLVNARGLEGLALLWIDQAFRGPHGRNFAFTISGWRDG